MRIFSYAVLLFVGGMVAWVFFHLGKHSAREAQYGQQYWNGYRDGHTQALQTYREWKDDVLEKLDI